MLCFSLTAIFHLLRTGTDNGLMKDSKLLPCEYNVHKKVFIRKNGNLDKIVLFVSKVL